MSSQKFQVTRMSFLSFFVACLFVAVLASQPTQAQNYKFKVLHTFHGKDGGSPGGVLVLDASENLYGTTGIGGSEKCTGGCGTVFKLNNGGKPIWQYNFDGHDGYGPVAGLLRDSSGNLFGTTVYGGTINNECGADGCGVVFKLGSTGEKENVAYKFPGVPYGMFPESLLVEDKQGNLYGTTYTGGVGFGIAFKVSPGGKLKNLHTFGGGTDGCEPYPGVILDEEGNVYGVASAGGSGEHCDGGYGLVFEITSSGQFEVLHDFSFADGSGPNSVLLFDSLGNLYGTTAYGGEGAGCQDNFGCGTVFKLTPQSGGTWQESVLYNFCSLSKCADGQRPFAGPLVRNASGDIYGTTLIGGAYMNCGDDACGTVFKLDSTGRETVLYSFTGEKDGAFPAAGLAMDSHGNLYGTTESGGASCFDNETTCGVVFKVTP
jgi:uncharacterized repeat protein (TIGR03803 family)